MYKSSVPWHIARPTDQYYSSYVQKRHDECYGYMYFDRLPIGPKETIYKMLNPDPAKRLTIPELQETDFMKKIEYCHDLPGENKGNTPIYNEVRHVHALTM